MIDVFPDKFREVDYSNPYMAIKQLELRIRYDEECLDFAIRGLAKLLEAIPSGSPGNLRKAVESLTSDMKKTKILTGIAPPTSSTEGAVGQLYIDMNAHELYFCSGIAVGTVYNYSWTKIN